MVQALRHMFALQRLPLQPHERVRRSGRPRRQLHIPQLAAVLQEIGRSLCSVMGALALFSGFVVLCKGVRGSARPRWQPHLPRLAAVSSTQEHPDSSCCIVMSCRAQCELEIARSPESIWRAARPRRQLHGPQLAAVPKIRFRNSNARWTRNSAEPHGHGKTLPARNATQFRVGANISRI